MSIWNHRKFFNHGNTFEESQSLKNAKIATKIRTTHANPSSAFSPMDHEKLFTTPLETLLSKPIRYKLNWYSLYKVCSTPPTDNSPSNNPTSFPTHHQNNNRKNHTVTTTSSASLQSLHSFFHTYAQYYQIAFPATTDYFNFITDTTHSVNSRSRQ